MSIHVFLGPTLREADARALLPGAIYLPPAAMGDVYAVTRKRPAAIAIIDGLFEQTPSVWHKEILFALSQGIRVLGSSSMGALRAAELHGFGMEGVGRIFEAFRDGLHEDDDEVTVVHGPAGDGYRPLSEAMVNLRLGLRLAEEGGVISQATHLRLLAAAKATYYADRSWPALRQAGERLGLPAAELDALLAWVRRARPDQKRADAVELLRRLAVDQAAGLAPHRPTFRFEPTTFWVQMTQGAVRVPGEDGAEAIRGEQVRNHLRASRRADLQRGALLQHLVRSEAARSGLTVTMAEIAEATARFRRAHGLLGVAETEAWMKRNRLTRAELAELMKTEALLARMIAAHGRHLDRYLEAELQRRGEFGDVVVEVERKWAHLSEHGIDNPTLADAGIDDATLMDWYQRRSGPVTGNLINHARELGFDSERDLTTELLAQYIYERCHGAGAAHA